MMMMRRRREEEEEEDDGMCVWSCQQLHVEKSPAGEFQLVGLEWKVIHGLPLSLQRRHGLKPKTRSKIQLHKTQCITD